MDMLIENSMHQADRIMADGAENKVTLKVEGLICGHYVGHVRKGLDAVTGVIEAKADLDSGTVEIRFGAEIDIAKHSEAVSDAGYPAQAA